MVVRYVLIESADEVKIEENTGNAYTLAKYPYHRKYQQNDIALKIGAKMYMPMKILDISNTSGIKLSIQKGRVFSEFFSPLQGVVAELQAAVVKEDYDELVRLQTRFDLEPPTALPNFDKILNLLMFLIDSLTRIRDATRKGEMAEVEKQSIRKNELKKQLLQELQKLI